MLKKSYILKAKDNNHSKVNFVFMIEDEKATLVKFRAGKAAWPDLRFIHA